MNVSALIASNTLCKMRLSVCSLMMRSLKWKLKFRVCVLRSDQRRDDGVPGETPSAARGVDAPRAGGAAQHGQQDRGGGEK